MSFEASVRELAEKAKAYSTWLFQHGMPPGLIFHNYDHTCAVVETAEEIGLHYGLSKLELSILRIAAWFHDIGYAYTYRGHEEISKILAEGFLQKQNANDLVLRQVLACIEATKQPQMPKGLLEQIICDADLGHLGKKYYPVVSQKLRKEIQTFTAVTLPDHEWHRQNVEFLSNHAYFTAYARETFSVQKQLNLLRECRLLQEEDKKN